LESLGGGDLRSLLEEFADNSEGLSVNKWLLEADVFFDGCAYTKKNPRERVDPRCFSMAHQGGLEWTVYGFDLPVG